VLHILTAAGGNPTAIWLQDAPLTRAQYAARGADLLSAGAALVRLSGGSAIPEQAGFLLRAERHLELAGGELCGNATLSAAALLGAHLGRRSFEMTTSDHPARRPVWVTLLDDGVVCCALDGLPMHREDRRVDGQAVSVVDMGGIVHVLIEGALPQNTRGRHRAVTGHLGLDGRAAVGVCWFQRRDDAAVIEPIVRVKTAAGETLIHESACGSGSIALAAVTGCRTIHQPAGQAITVTISGERTTLSARIVSALSATL
jgi:diaminopimelate epimerase